MPREDRLSIAICAVKESPDTESGTNPTARVYGIYPRVLGTRTRRSLAERAKKTRKATKETRRLKIWRQVRDAARRANEPDMRALEAVRILSPGSTVLVHREYEGWLEYPLECTDYNTAIVELRGGRRSTFSLDTVRQLLSEESRKAGTGHENTTRAGKE